MKQEQIKNIDFGNWPLPKDVLTEIGRLHSIWSSMESALTLNIAKLAGYNDMHDMRPHILLNHSTFQQKLDIFSSLCDHLSNQFTNLSQYEKVVSLLKTAQKYRNTFTHQSIVYIQENDELQLAKSSSRGKLKTPVKKIDITEIKKALWL